MFSAEVVVEGLNRGVGYAESWATFIAGVGIGGLMMCVELGV